MTQNHDDDRPDSEEEVQDLQESAKEMGVEDADERSPDEIVEKVRDTQADDQISPSEWETKDDE